MDVGQDSCPMSHSVITCFIYLDDFQLMSSGISGMSLATPFGVQFQNCEFSALG